MLITANSVHCITPGKCGLMMALQIYYRAFIPFPTATQMAWHRDAAQIWANDCKLSNILTMNKWTMEQLYGYFGTPNSLKDSDSPRRIQLSISALVATAITPSIPSAFAPASLFIPARRLGITIIHRLLMIKL